MKPATSSMTWASGRLVRPCCLESDLKYRPRRADNTVVPAVYIVMSLYIRCCVVLLVIWLQPLPVSAASSDARDAALAFVEQRHIGNNLASMGWIVAIRTTTFGVLSKKLGEPATSLLVHAKLDEFREKYQARWDANLASAYADFMTADELHSLVRYGSASSAVAKLRSVRNDVGREMQAASTSILESYVSDAMIAAFKEAYPASASQRR
ncbi:hypothetical protein B0G84_4109 [Paraburkholderia sp. BL8N3]|nr:hypothetical protein B0G84_4109 [Paraburkholderia sp. BL8N3]